MKTMMMIALAAALPMAASATASDRVSTMPNAEAGGNVETLAVEITGESGMVWQGTLTIGPRYGSASYSQSKSEAVAPCEGEAFDPNRRTNVNSSFNLNLSRTNWQQDQNSFNVNFNQTLALPACEGQGTDSSGFNRMVEILPGSTQTIRGNNGVTVMISRP